MKTLSLSLAASLLLTGSTLAETTYSLTYPIVDTPQGTCFNSNGLIDCPAEGEAFCGQDAQYSGIAPSYTDNGDGTVTDAATGLMWVQDDNGEGLSWEGALAYAETATLAGQDDWRLPNVKELQGIVDDTRSPDTTSSAALDPVFDSTEITNEAGQLDYGWIWSSTTQMNWTEEAGNAEAYVSFGRAMGCFDGVWTDAHGAGAQRSDFKTGDPADYPEGNGPQGDAQRICNFVRPVRNAG